VRIAQAGLSWSKRRFIITSAILGVLGFLVALGLNGAVLAAVGMAFAGGFGLPRWILKFLNKRREANFLKNFPDAVDVIVPGIKAGLPLLDSIRVIVNDSPEPIRSEFRAIVETQSFGLPLGEACAAAPDGTRESSRERQRQNGAGEWPWAGQEVSRHHHRLRRRAQPPLPWQQ
jgi:tight adherence protein B